jgi:hypothetical protein
MRRRENSGVPLDCKLPEFPELAAPILPLPTRAPVLAPGNRAGSRARAARVRGDYDCSVKLTVTVMMTGTGTPFSIVGVYSH